MQGWVRSIQKVFLGKFLTFEKKLLTKYYLFFGVINMSENDADFVLAMLELTK